MSKWSRWRSSHPQNFESRRVLFSLNWTAHARHLGEALLRRSTFHGRRGGVFFGQLHKACQVGGGPFQKTCLGRVRGLSTNLRSRFSQTQTSTNLIHHTNWWGRCTTLVGPDSPHQLVGPDSPHQLVGQIYHTNWGARASSSEPAALLTCNISKTGNSWTDLVSERPSQNRQASSFSQ